MARAESFSPLDRLLPLLQWVRGFPQQNRFKRFGAKLRDTSPFHRIRYCSQALLSGALPDAKTLEFVAIAFDRYVNSEGALSLDEAFRLSSKPKAGNPARQYARGNKVLGLLFDMAMMRAHKPKMSLASAAEAARGDDESIPVETLEREYRRRGCNKWAKGIAEYMRGK